MNAVAELRRELDRLSVAGSRIDLWWRDDDAVRATPALERLLALSNRLRMPLALAAVPAGVEPSLPERLEGADGIDVLVHGFSHANHAPPGEKPAEFGSGRSAAEVRAELARAHALALAAFGPRALPVFVPPWNRLAPEMSALVAEAGFRAVSGFAGRKGAGPAGLPRIDTHLDPVAWRGDRSLAGSDILCSRLRHVSASIGVNVRFSAEVGFLTHHLVFDEALWMFCEEFLTMAASHPAVRMRSVRQLLANLSGTPEEPGLGTEAARGGRAARLEGAW